MIEVDIVTPSRRIVEGAHVSKLKLPARDGEIEILPGHVDLLTLLGTGVLSYQEGGMIRKFAVSYGFAEVRRDRVIVMAETCEEASSIDKARARKALQEAEEALAQSLSEEDFNKFQMKLKRAAVRTQVAE